MAKTKLSYDIFWKDLITIMLEDFIAFCMPDLHKQIDYTVEPVFLEQEFDKLISDLKKRGIKFCDKLVKVRLKDGTDKWLFIHIEIQKNPDTKLPVRMFIYFYRIYDKYGIDGTDIESMVVFLHRIKRKKYNRFTYESGKTRLVFDYRTIGIFEFAEKELYQNKNPFALVILASQKAMEKDTDAEQRLSFKRKFTRMAYERGIAKPKIAAILQFVYYAIQLPEDLNKQYEQYFNELINPNDMTTLQATWNETWRGEKFDNLFGDILDERISAVKQEMNKKIDDLYRQNQEARRKEEEARRKEEEILKKSVLKFREKGFSISEISESLEIPEVKIKTILQKK